MSNQTKTMATLHHDEIYFGGPDLPPGRLRDILAERVAAIPAGGSIDWVTYYFRDRQLAEELLRAHHRGVRVTVTLEGRPRTPDANDEVIAMLSGPDGLDKGFRTLSLAGVPTPSGKVWKPRLHEKLYCFSHPKPVAFIGSFNPSGDDPEERPDIISEIGDQNRGHNVLVGLTNPSLVDGLVSHARWISRARHSLFSRFFANGKQTLQTEDTQVYFLPQLRTHAVVRFLGRFGKGACIRIAASHIRGKSTVNAILGLSQRGAALEILAESTLRRVPTEVEQQLTSTGILFRRVSHPEGLPMHNKFVLVEENRHRWVVFGSYNWTTRSYWLNHEICAISADPKLFNAFAERWEVMKSQKG
jgi:phosphatidylserine/phosphatidylglycerophosphate/cardiolipin synthase-like enzyme